MRSSFAYIAYIDAGSGSLLVQLLAGGIVGLGAFVKFKWTSLRERLREVRGPTQAPKP
jgi:hypothetical protein